MHQGESALWSGGTRRFQKGGFLALFSFQVQFFSFGLFFNWKLKVPLLAPHDISWERYRCVYFREHQIHNCSCSFPWNHLHNTADGNVHRFSFAKFSGMYWKMLEIFYVLRPDAIYPIIPNHEICESFKPKCKWQLKYYNSNYICSRFSNAFSYYGLVLLTTELFQEGKETCGGMSWRESCLSICVPNHLKNTLL